MTTNAELSALDAALADLDALEGDSVTTEATTEATTDTAVDMTAIGDDVDAEALLADLELEEELAAIDELPDLSDDMVAKTKEPAAKAETKKPAAKKPAAKADKTPAKEDVKEPVADADKGDDEATKPKSRANGGVRPSEALKVRLGGVEAVSATLIHKPEDATLDADKLQSLIADRLKEIDQAPKKVGEKLVNAYAHLTSGTTLSVYTEMAMTILLEKGELTSQTLFEAYRARPYSEGTSRSQSGQLMKVLPLMGMATRDGQKLTLIDDSVLAGVFKEKLGIVEEAAA
ncbi:hypothetical protein JCM19235_1300 [Vibrio maritimus]|uniref:Uncharacterized protein n=1 Tax=Vibrio maritimus TaxID=990268 RepID=A0A090S931_9VIBR|nr:hypothetical protein JCM19235_1300 [Vibrio maritimus]